MLRPHVSAVTLIGSAIVGGWGCTVPEQLPVEESVAISAAVAVLHPTEGSEARGIVRFSAVADSVQVTADIAGLAPGQHGFHVHQLGDCSAPDGTSAGGHFNPEDMQHGGPLASERHVGDLGNLRADSSGTAQHAHTDGLLALVGAHSIIGRAVIVHAGADDLSSQPTGAAGARVACGVIGIAQ